MTDAELKLKHATIRVHGSRPGDPAFDWCRECNAEAPCAIDALLERVERLEGALRSLLDWPWSPHITSEVARAALRPEPGEPG